MQHLDHVPTRRVQRRFTYSFIPLQSKMPSFKEITASLSPKQLQEIRTIFDVFDHNRDGFISMREFKKTMVQLDDGRIPLSRKQMNNMFQDADTDQDKRISWEEFIEASSTPYPELKKTLKAVSTRPPVAEYQKKTSDEAMLDL